MAIGRVPGATGIQPSIVDAKGDLIVATAADSVARLAVGTNGYTLVADSVETTGLKWVAPASGGMTLLSTTTLSGSAVDISVSSGYRDLYIICAGATATGNFEIYFRPNNSTASIYYETGTTSVSTSVNNLINPDSIFTVAPGGVSQLSSDANNIIWYQLINYDSSTQFKPIQIIGQYLDNASVVKTGGMNGVWRSSAQITSVRFQIQAAGGVTFNGGTVLIYGVK